MTDTVEKKRQHGFIGWEISEESRKELLAAFPPAFPDFIGEHITHKFPAWSDDELPSAENIYVVGIAHDLVNGVQTFVVMVDGTTRRPDGKIYHLTWSIDRARGAKPSHSNKVIATQGADALKPINISATARFFNHNH